MKGLYIAYDGYSNQKMAAILTNAGVVHSIYFEQLFIWVSNHSVQKVATVAADNYRIIDKCTV